MYVKDKRLKICLGVLIFGILCCLGYILWLFWGYYKAESEYSMVRQGFVTQPEQDLALSPTESESPFPERDIDIEGLLSVNPDFVAWIYYEDGKIDYPVAKETEDDINKYLNTTFEGQRNTAGCIFMPYDASSDFKDLNTFLYGHNMKNGSMFGTLKYLYRDPSENFKDPYFYIWTKNYERIMYRVVSMYVVDKDSEMYSVPMNTEGYVEYRDKILELGSVESYQAFTDTEKSAMGQAAPFVTLSVCYGSAGTRNRLLVHGVEVLREPYVREGSSVQ